MMSQTTGTIKLKEESLVIKKWKNTLKLEWIHNLFNDSREKPILENTEETKIQKD